MEQSICTSLSHTHYWYEVGMLKVSAFYIELELLESYDVTLTALAPLSHVWRMARGDNHHSSNIIALLILEV